MHLIEILISLSRESILLVMPHSLIPHSSASYFIFKPCHKTNSSLFWLPSLSPLATLSTLDINNLPLKLLVGFIWQCLRADFVFYLSLFSFSISVLVYLFNFLFLFKNKRSLSPAFWNKLTILHKCPAAQYFTINSVNYNIPA